MGLKETFIKYCEMHRSARNVCEQYGEEDERTVSAYGKANEVKREVLNMIEEQERFHDYILRKEKEMREEQNG